VKYLHEHDFNEDGVEDSADSTIEHSLDGGARGPGGGLVPRRIVKFEELDEISANILSFSEYAIAW
jgi:hypothetical protein